MPKKKQATTAKKPGPKSTTAAEAKRAEALASVRGAFEELAKQIGPKAFREMGIKFGLEQEEHLRANDPTNPMLRLIDEWRAEQEADPIAEKRYRIANRMSVAGLSSLEDQ